MDECIDVVSEILLGMILDAFPAEADVVRRIGKEDVDVLTSYVSGRRTLSSTLLYKKKEWIYIYIYITRASNFCYTVGSTGHE